MMTRINPMGNWEVFLPRGTLKHGDLYKLSFIGKEEVENEFFICQPGGSG